MDTVYLKRLNKFGLEKKSLEKKKTNCHEDNRSYSCGFLVVCLCLSLSTYGGLYSFGFVIARLSQVICCVGKGNG